MLLSLTLPLLLFSYKFKPFHPNYYAQSQTVPLQTVSSSSSSSLTHFLFSMMHHCCSSSQQGHIMGGGGTCTCGMFHPQTNSNYSMLFSNYQNHDHYDHYDSYSYTSPSSSVDCTLSLATPSTRLSEDQEKRNRRSSLTNFWNNNSNHSNSNSNSNSKHNSQSQNKSNRGNNIGNNSNNDSLLARRCASCDTTSTPLWRNGPRGPKSLCNACGIRYKKEERRANAATSAATTGGVMETGNMYSSNNNNGSWYGQPQSQMYGNELRFMEDSDVESENGIPNFLSWRLNTSLVHDYTR